MDETVENSASLLNQTGPIKPTDLSLSVEVGNLIDFDSDRAHNSDLDEDKTPQASASPSSLYWERSVQVFL